MQLPLARIVYHQLLRIELKLFLIKSHTQGIQIKFYPMANAGYKISNPERIYFISFAISQWIDAYLPAGRFSLEVDRTE